MCFKDASFDALLPKIATVFDQKESEAIELNQASSVLASLRYQLVARIDDLLVHRRELLMSLLYRVDVKESLVLHALGTLPQEAIAPRLADLVIERQLAKVRSRREHRVKKF